MRYRLFLDFASHVSAASNIGCISVYSQQYSQLQEQELQVIQARRTEEMQRKVNKRKVIQKYGGLSLRDAEVKIAEKERKEREKEKKKQDRLIKRLESQHKRAVHADGVLDRRAERARQKSVRELIQEGQEVPLELQVPVIDREKVWLQDRAERALQLAIEKAETVTAWNHRAHRAMQVSFSPLGHLAKRHNIRVGL